ncbi:MAG: hypothetical protein HY279_10345 [Nitrospinae bacterium]|nr:hypothetical protein [Nitrospinota bacterium]
MPLTPTTQEEIRKKAKDKLWDIKAVRILDSEKIQKWLKEEANDAMPLSVVGPDEAKAKQYYDNALKKYKSFSDTLENLYDANLIKADNELLKDAEKGVFQQKAPTVSAIWFWLFSLVMAGGLELVFFGYMVFYKSAGPALIGLAILLLVGGLFAGHGVANIMIHGQKNEYEATEVRIAKKYIVLLGIGIALIVGITVLRGIYGGFLAGAVAALFGLAVTTTESFLLYYAAIRDYYLKQMFRAQQHYAAIQLANDLKEQENEIDDTWRIHYIQHLDDIVTNLRKTTT